MALTQEDKRYIKEEIVAVREEVREDIQAMSTRTEALWGLLRGNNGDGIVTQFRLVQQSLKNLEISMRSLVDRTDVNRVGLQDCQLRNLPRVQQTIDSMTRIEQKVAEFVDSSDERRKEDKEEHEKKSKEYGSWQWFREKRFDPVLMAAVCYIVVEVIKYFAFYR